MIQNSRLSKTRPVGLPSKVQAALAYIRITKEANFFSSHRESWRVDDDPNPLENAVYAGALVALLEYFEAPVYVEEDISADSRDAA